MSLRDLALADVGSIIQDAAEFGEPIVLTDPDGVTYNATGLTGDINTAIDANTGLVVKGRQIHVTLAIASLPAGARPAPQPDLSSKPWLVSFPRITTGTVTQYAVIASDPDDSMGSIILELGNYRP